VVIWCRRRRSEVLALAVEFLTGRYVASAFDDRDAPEWPPHPARLFSALAAALAETGGNPGERSALEWLERQAPPAVAFGERWPRETCVSYVPVNDSAAPVQKVPKGGLKVHPVVGEGFPLGRLRQPRAFPSVTVYPPVIHFIWIDAEPPGTIAEALARLAAKVTYLGHSSSLVSVRVGQSSPPPSLIPVREGVGEVVLRVSVPGQLSALEEAHRVHVETGIRSRLPCGFQAYTSIRGAAALRVHRSVFGDMVVLRRRSGPRLPVTAAEAVCAALRGAVMAACEEPVPETLTGHTSSGDRSERPHVAFLALPDVGHQHADGHLLGAAAVLPRDLDTTERRTVLRAIAGVNRLEMGRAGVWTVERVDATVTQRGLRTDMWVGPSRRWATVTPVELDIHPDEPYGRETESSLAMSCERIGLPRPVHVLVTPQSIVLGSEPWHAFARARCAGSGPRRPLVHVVVSFEEEVAGPVLLGAGRYRGLGLCRSVREGSSRPCGGLTA
jgi:CRISPR-associated protein Csb2